MDLRAEKDKVLARIAPYVEQGDGDIAYLPLLINKIAIRITQRERIDRVMQSASLGFYKQAAIDMILDKRRWLPVSEESYHEQLGCLPPQYQSHGMFMVGENYSGSYAMTMMRRSDKRGDTSVDKFYCCMLTPEEVVDPKFIFELECDDYLPLTDSEEFEPHEI